MTMNLCTLSLTMLAICCILPHTRCHSSELKNIFQEFLWDRFQLTPSLATRAGNFSLNHLYGNYTVEDAEAKQTLALRYMDRINAIDRDSIDSADQVNYDVLKAMLSTKIEGYSFFNYTFGIPLSFLEGVATDGFVGVLAGDNSEAGFKELHKRLQLYPHYVDQLIAAMGTAISNGLISHSSTVIRAQGNIRQLIAISDVEKTGVYKAFMKYPANATDRDSFLQQIKDFYTNSYKKSLIELDDFIEKEYMPATRASVGVDSLQGGDKYYEACVRFHTTTNMTADAIHKLGLSEVARIEGEMQKILDRDDFTGTVKDYIDKLRANPDSYLNTSEEVVEYYQDIKKFIDSKLETIFHKKDFPKAECLVKPMEFDGPLARYEPPNSGKKEGVFSINTFRPNETGLYIARALIAHEASPGHHFQVALQVEDENIPAFRRVFSSAYFKTPNQYPYFTSFPEGWGLYAEYLGEEMGLYTTDFHLFGRYTLEMFRAVRLVVDTGLHSQGWSRQRAIDYMTKYVADSEEGIAAEIDRYIMIPGQALAYKIGEIKIKQLRARAEAALGTHFDVRDFHGKILRLGMVPLHQLETVIDDWIDMEKAKINSAGWMAPCKTIITIATTIALSLSLW